MINQSKSFWLDAIDCLGLTIIGLYILLSSIFVSGFAVVHFTLSSGVPLFVGEQCLFLSLTLLAVKLMITKDWRPWHWLWAAYALWILWSTWAGLHKGTFLAFRHAALFYYAFFALLGYSFYNRRILVSPLTTCAVLVVLILFLSSGLIAPYYCFSCVMLAIVLILRLRSRMVRGVLMGLLILWYLQFMFCGSRSHLTGSLTAVFFIGTVLTFAMFSWKFRYRFLIFTGFLILLVLGVRCFSDPNAVKSLTMPVELQDSYRQYRDFIEAHKTGYIMSPYTVKLYDDNLDDRRARSRSFGSPEGHAVPAQQVAAHVSGQALSKADQARAGDGEASINTAQTNQFSKTDTVEAQNAPRPLENVYGNIMFRWFIWNDMWDDLLQAHSLWGVGFGKPQRSRSLEILRWGTSEWSRDGWIAPHNSFFHMVYRGGIIGVSIILAIILIFIRLSQVFISKLSFTGIFLLSILVYWVAMANFLVILELPYNAVLFWTIFGMIFAYAKGNEAYENR